jgi:hypothetical protein
LLRKKYADYEAEMRFDKRLMEMLKLNKLPCKSTINNYALMFTLSFLSNFNKKLISAWIKKPVDLLLDASGIRLVGRSIWFCIRTKKEILKKDCDKIHIAVSLCSLLIANFKISNSKRNDSPFLKKLLKPFRMLGLVIADNYSTKWYMRRREMAMRFIAYNVRIIIGIQIAREKNIPLWVRA